MAGFKELEVWQLGRTLATRMYEWSYNFPASEQFGLTAQIRRAAISIPSNVAEGYGRRHDSDYARFLRIAKGSLNELETLAILAEDLGLGVFDEETQALISTVGSKLTNVISRIQPGLIRESVSVYDSDGLSDVHD